MTRLLFAVPALVLSAASLKSCLKPGKDPLPEAKPRGQITAEACGGYDLPAEVSLAGWEDGARAALSVSLFSRITAVRVVRVGCKVSLSVVPGCRVPGRYRFLRRHRVDDRKIASAEGLFAELPLAAAGLAGRFNDGADFALSGEVSTELSLSRETSVRRSALSKGACRKATHVVTAAELGRYELSAGGAVLARAGKAGSCADRAQVRPKGCVSPLRLRLVPVKVAEPPPTELVAVPAGPYERGKPGKKITISRFEIDRTEVSAGQYDACVAAGKCTAAGTGQNCTSGVLGKEDHPINCVAWRGATAYCEHLGKRLPTEAEWEKAARGEDQRDFVWGAAWPPPADTGNFAGASARKSYPYWEALDGYDDGQVTTSPVGGFEAGRSPFGALNMAGNVSEWVHDWYAADYGGGDTDPKGPRKGPAKVVRGAAFGHARKADLEVTHRHVFDSRYQSMYIGFRCVR